MDGVAMGRYSSEELSEMAMVVIEDQAVGGVQAFQLTVILATVLNMEPERVFDEICKLVIR